ncbi:MAG: NAD-dependent epimerase/dehydratase family protein [Bacteroidota bacterium]
MVDKYIEEGHEVVVVDNLSTGFRSNLNPKARFYEADICNRGAVDEIFERERPEVVNHHAAQMDVRRSVDDPVFDATTNIIGSLNLILSSVRHKIRKFIYISTGGAVYGEPQYLPVDENHPVNPESQYGVSKHTVEHYLYLYRHQSGLTFTVLRYPNVYGPRQNPKGEAGVIAIFIGKMLGGVTPTIYGEGEQVRDYLHVNDIVRANSLALVKGDDDFYNIGSGIGTTVNELYRLLSKLLSFRSAAKYAPPRTGELQKIYLNAQKAKQNLGWEAEIPIDEGLHLTIDWTKKKAVTND